ncbi:MAG: ABC transporter permease [Candidatus Methanoperedens sp.]|nr:ABC transporter permease [Candidatus Methanoperedens sp.]
MDLNNIASQLRLLTQKLLAIVVFLLIWEIVPRVGLADPVFLPPASSAFTSLGHLILSGELLKHTSISLQRAFAGFAIAAVTAIPLGFAVGWFKTFEKYMDPLLQTMRQLPILALFPVFILLFGIGEISKIVIIAIACFWSIFMNTVSGVMHVDALLIKSARSMGVSHSDMFKKVVLPAAAPSVFTGLRYAGTVALMVLVAAEMIGANSGLGFFVFMSETRFAISAMYATIVALTILGVIVNYILVVLEKRATRWKEEIVHS